jgi:DNA-binding Xre family transcriptional regulator
MKLRINEAILRSEMNGKKVFKKDIAARIFPGVSEAAQQVNFTNLCQGKTKRVAPEWVLIICEMCDCTPNYLFNFNE